MPLALRQLSALYLTAASAYTVAIVLSHHPALAERAGEAGMIVRTGGAEATVAIEDYLLRPMLRTARAETVSIAGKLVAIVDGTVSRNTPTHVSQLLPEARRAGGPFVKPLPLHIGRTAQAFPAPADAQLIPPPPANTPPPRTNGQTDGNGLRLSEVEPDGRQPAPVPSGRDKSLPAGAASSAAGIPAPAVPAAQRVQRVAREQDAAPQMQIAPNVQSSALPPDQTSGGEPAVSSLPPPTTQEIAQVQERLKENLSSEMYNNFELFLYVSKAAKGPWSQRMFVFQKEPTGDLALAYNWPVSTGRETVDLNPAGQQLSTNTPAGYYELDPHRFFTHYVSGQWGESMPYAMFFNWKKDGQATGLAIHSASGSDVGLLGTRASAGCVRLPPDAARTLFTLIRSKYRGLTPRFAVNHDTGTMSNDGILLHDANGDVQLADGYKVLVFIEDYGGENVVAAMY